MDRQGIVSEDYFTDALLGQHQDNIEAADLDHQVDLHGAGILTGLEVTEDDPAPSMSVLVAAGTAYQGYGRRIRIDVGQTLDCSVDRAAAAVIPSAGKERYITLLAVFDRQNSAPVLDPQTGESISRTSNEYFELQVAAGAEADPGAAVKYSAAAEEVILGDVLLADDTAQITNAMIDTARRSVLANAANQIAAHVAAAAAHPAENISFDSTGTGLPGDPDDVQAALEVAAKLYLRQLIITSSTTIVQGVDIPADVLTLHVLCRGPGGGGGGGAAGVGGGAGGAGGGVAEGVVTLSPDEEVPVVIGTKGLGGAANTAGTTGTTTSFGSYMSATGGPGGGPASACASSPGGIGIGGDRNLRGGQGVANLVGAQGGPGGGSPGGANMSGTGPVDGPAASAVAPGGGGQGGNDTTTTGGDGFGGEVILTFVTREAP